MSAEDEVPPTEEQSNGRLRKYTEKGLEWQVSQTRQNLWLSVSSWRSQASKISVMLSDCSDVGILRTDRYNYEPGHEISNNVAF